MLNFKYTFLLISILFKTLCFSQDIKIDVFGDLVHESSVDDYEAYLKKDIFNNLNFTDNQNNKIVFEEKYLQLKYSNVIKNIQFKMDFFKILIDEHKRDVDYKITYSIDIYDKVIVKSSNGNKEELGENIFGGLEYHNNSKEASLKKNIFDHWQYEDSNGNSFEFGKTTWKKLIEVYGTKENIFDYLINNFLF